VLAALMITARAGSAIAATIATMRITEQIDALEVMSIDPLHYLVMPRLVACLIAVPLLTVMFSAWGILVGKWFGMAVFGIDGSSFIASIRSSLRTSDLTVGIVKSLAFAGLLAWVATYNGFVAKGGAVGVGAATTRAVVIISALVLVSDYALSALLFY
jgi:phospholipid/cholesterol/gamma-HCH transport system permease protein